MRVRLTRSRLQAVWNVVLMSNRPWAVPCLQLIHDRQSAVTETKVTVDLPAAAWAEIRDLLVERCFKANGQRVNGRDFATRALEDITGALNEWITHPAFLGHRAQGHVATELEGFVVGGKRSPFPMEGASYVLFVPVHEHGFGLRTTRWKAMPLAMGSGMDPSEERAQLIFR